jgi:chromosome segregation ATPase
MTTTETMFTLLPVDVAQQHLTDATAAVQRCATAINQAQQDYTAMESNLGDAALDADPTTYDELAQRLGTAHARVALARQAHTAAERRQRAAQRALWHAQAEAHRQQADECEAKAQELDDQAAPLLVQLEEITGVRYEEPQLTSTRKSVPASRPHVLRTQARDLRRQANGLDRQAHDLAARHGAGE